MKSLYEVTGSILDFNTVLVNRKELREMPEQMWDKFIASYAKKHGFVDKNGQLTMKSFLGSIEHFKREFLAAQEE